MSAQRVKQLVGNIQLLPHHRRDTYVNHLKCNFALLNGTGSSHFVHGVFRAAELESTDTIFIDGLVEKIMVSPTYHTNFVVQTVIKLLNKRDMKILFVVSNSKCLKTP